MKKLVVNYIGIIFGLALAAFGVVAFILPAGIMIGSTTGIGRIVQYFYDIPVSYTVAAINGLLLLLSLIILGKKFALSIVVSTFVYPLFMNLFERIEILGQITDNSMIAALYGGALIGIGLGIVIKCGASTGGTDVIAIILNRKMGISIGLPMYLIDFSILVSQVFFAKGSEEVLLGIMMTFLYSMVADKVVVAGGGAVQLFIISSKFDQIRQHLKQMVVGTTVLRGESGYMEDPRDILLCVISARELNKVKAEVLNIDGEAFMTISSVKEVKGRGFSFEIGKAKQIRAQKAQASSPRDGA